MQRSKTRLRSARPRHDFGDGGPSRTRPRTGALQSAQNDVALVAQAHIQPFKRERRPDSARSLKVDRSGFQRSPLLRLSSPPREALEGLGEHDVRLKVTLSYFIEPSPGEMAPVTPSRYQSFGLRFALKRPTETRTNFRQRINRLERGEERIAAAEPDPRWIFGSQSIAAGSLHSDVCIGPAAELAAARDLIAIYPVSGWWRYRTPLRRFRFLGTRYALIVSITAQDVEVQLYTEIANPLWGLGSRPQSSP